MNEALVPQIPTIDVEPFLQYISLNYSKSLPSSSSSSSSSKLSSPSSSPLKSPQSSSSKSSSLSSSSLKSKSIASFTSINVKNENIMDRMKQVAQQIDKACSTDGFFYLTNFKNSFKPSFSFETIFEKANKFFLSSTDDQKQKLKKESQQDCELGYQGFDFDKVQKFVHEPDKVITIDVKEALHFGIETDHPSNPFQGLNKYPDPDWKSYIEEYINNMITIGKSLLYAFAMALDLELNVFDQLFEDPVALLRILHYPPPSQYTSLVPHQQRRVIVQGCKAHTDYGFVTILAQDKVGGLQIQRDGSWINVPYKKDCFVINLGEALATWTGGRYKATPHRVVLSSTQQQSSHRFSAPFFFEPNAEAWIVPLQPLTCPPQLNTEELKGKAMKYKDFLRHREKINESQSEEY